jgi:hypothetical protein
VTLQSKFCTSKASSQDKAREPRRPVAFGETAANFKEFCNLLRFQNLARMSSAVIGIIGGEAELKRND